jgi:hypothetical protein
MQKATTFQIIHWFNSAQEFDSIYNKKIAKRYDKYEIQRLSSTKRKDVRERKAGAGRP